jgi:lycopene beta-cyclase
MRDLLILGAGPSALVLAQEAASRGLTVSCVAPDWTAEWTNNYGVWVDDAPESLKLHLEAVWPKVSVHFGTSGERVLERAYGRIDGCGLRRALLARGDHLKVERLQGWVAGVEHESQGSSVVLRSGARYPTRMVVDCTGHDPALVERRFPDGVAAQIAFGMMVRVKGHPFPLDTMRLMDFDEAFDQPPTFLYAMPFSEQRIFVEETALTARPPVSFAELERRLYQRLEHLGVEIEEIETIERCFIPMNGAPANRAQRIVGFGAAAGLVHPASGYLLARTFDAAPSLAEVLARSLLKGNVPRVARAAWDVLWPRKRRQSFGLFRLGHEIMLPMETDGLLRFLSAFFAMHPKRLGPYLSGTAEPRAVLATMGAMFLRAPWSVRFALVRAMWGPAARRLVDAALAK